MFISNFFAECCESSSVFFDRFICSQFKSSAFIHPRIDDELTSVGKNGHPDWFTGRKIGLCPTADLGNEECVAYLKRKMPQFFLRYGIGTWRSDFEPIACRSDRKNRHDANGSDVQYWCSRGFYDLTDHILKTVPGFRYESCSSGGSMKDFATFRRASVLAPM